MLRLIIRSVLWGAAGALAVPVSAAAILMIVGSVLELLGVEPPSGDSGGFAMGITSLVLMLMPVSALAFAGFTFARGYRQPSL